MVLHRTISLAVTDGNVEVVTEVGNEDPMVLLLKETTKEACWFVGLPGRV